MRISKWQHFAKFLENYYIGIRKKKITVDEPTYIEQKKIVLQKLKHNCNNESEDVFRQAGKLVMEKFTEM